MTFKIKENKIWKLHQYILNISIYTGYFLKFTLKMKVTGKQHK